MTEELVEHLGYFGIALILLLGGFGLPIPEEAPVLLAAILTRNGKLSGVLAFSACMIGVLLGDFLVYLVGYRFGERVLSHPWTRRLLTKPREAQIKGYFQRHGFKILIMGRFAVGFRTAAYLTAGILKLPPLKLLLTDVVAVLLSTSLVFTLGYLFAHQIEKGLHEAQQWVAIAIAVGVAVWLVHRHYKAQRRAGLPVGPPVLVNDDLPLPPDDLVASPETSSVESAPVETTRETSIADSASVDSMEVRVQTPLDVPSSPTTDDAASPPPTDGACASSPSQK